MHMTLSLITLASFTFTVCDRLVMCLWCCISPWCRGPTPPTTPTCAPSRPPPHSLPHPTHHPFCAPPSLCPTPPIIPLCAPPRPPPYSCPIPPTTLLCVTPCLPSLSVHHPAHHRRSSGSTLAGRGCGSKMYAHGGKSNLNTRRSKR